MLCTLDAAKVDSNTPENPVFGNSKGRLINKGRGDGSWGVQQRVQREMSLWQKEQSHCTWAKWSMQIQHQQPDSVNAAK